MKGSTDRIIQDLIVRHPQLDCIGDKIIHAVSKMIEAYRNGKKMLICGNGGSAADSIHIVGELMKDFAISRKLPAEMQEKIRAIADEHAEYITANLTGSLRAISLVSEIALNTAYANDKAADLCFAQQVFGNADFGDILIAISTSGNSMNIIYAAMVAKAKGVTVVALTGTSGGKLENYCDCLINVPETETYRVQELHLPVYHTICLALENEFFGDQYYEAR